MVRTATLDGVDLFACEVCDLAFAARDRAQACEAHCRANPSCSLAIGREAVAYVEDGVFRWKPGRAPR